MLPERFIYLERAYELGILGWHAQMQVAHRLSALSMRAMIRKVDAP